MFMDPCIVT